MNPIHRLKIAAGAAVLVMAFALAVPALAQAPTPLNLFNGTSLLGWSPHGNWSVVGGTIASNGIGLRSIVTAVPFGDFSLQFEYSESGPVGATLRMWTAHEATGGLTIDLDNTTAKSGVGGVQGYGRSSMTTVSSGWHRVQVDASHGSVTVKVDGQPAGSANNLGSRAGYVGFAANMTGQLQVRSLRLTPLNLNSLFDGADLSGWKGIARAPESKGGVTHSAEKMLSFGRGGGSSKPHEATWLARGGAIHGEKGPGGLENATPMEDMVVQVNAAYHGDLKPDDLSAIALRNTAGQLGGGYAIGLGAYAGNIAGLSRVPLGRTNTPVDETIVLGGRTIAIWVGGNLTTVYNDPRPESANAAQGARTQAGVTTLLLPDSDKSQIDVSRVMAAPLPKPYGAVVAAVPVVAPPVAAASAPAAPAGPSAAETALLQQQQDSARKDADAQATKQRVAGLMGQALASTNPQEQESLYGQVIQLDPANPNAMQGYKEAQARGAAATDRRRTGREQAAGCAEQRSADQHGVGYRAKCVSRRTPVGGQPGVDSSRTAVAG